MGSFKSILLAGIASLSVISAASAADLFLPPPPPVEAPAQYVPVEFSGGFYLRGDVGAGALQLRNQNSTFNPDFGYGTPDGKPPGFGYQGATAAEQGFVDIGVGYQINHFFRADVTAEYRFPSKFKTVETYGSQAAGYFGADYYRGTISNAVFLVNGYVDLGTYHHVTPYLGAGVGTSVNIFSGVTDYNLSYNGQASGSSSSNTRASFAYALMAGFSYDVSENLKLDFGYRYLDMGRLATGEINCYGGSAVCGDNSRERQSYHLASHDIRLGLRYVFADVAPIPQYAPQQPLIRKY